MMILRNLNRVSGTLISKIEASFVPLGVAGTQVNQVRYKKPDIKEHRHAYWERMQILEFTKPRYDVKNKTTKDLWQECPREKELDEIKAERYEANELERLYAAQMREFFEQSSMIGIFHVNPIKHRPQRMAWQNARRHGFELKKYNNRICREALKNTKWEDVVMFHVEMGRMETQFAFCMDPADKIDPAKLLAYDKKVPEFILLGAIIENRMLDRAGLIHAATSLYPRGIESLHGELSTILQTPARKASQLLSRNQQKLSENLKQYIKDQSTNSANESSES